MQFQFVPEIAVAVRPAGTVSVTVTVPLLDPVPPLLTEMVYVAPVCPWLKFPLWLLAMAKSGVPDPPAEANTTSTQ